MVPAVGVTEDAVEVPANGVEKPSVPLDALEENGIPARKHDTALKHIKGIASICNKCNAFCYLRCTAFRLLTIELPTQNSYKSILMFHLFCFERM